MPLLFFRLTLLTIVALLMHLAGCASSAPTRFYVLSPLASSTSDSQVPKDEGCIAIGIGPVELPAYLDRPQIVTRVSENELSLSEFNKWAEPLKDNLTRVLVENLSTLICADAISIFPWKGPTPIDYQVEVTVIRMDGSVGGNASLVARWAIFREKDRKMLMMRQSRHTPLLWTNSARTKTNRFFQYHRQLQIIIPKTFNVFIWLRFLNSSTRIPEYSIRFCNQFRIFVQILLQKLLHFCFSSQFRNI